jgi:hypothetical protein
VISQSKLVTKSQRSTHHDSETWSIRGRRYVAISETDAEMVLDEAMVKNLASAPTMAMRGLYRDKESQMPVAWTIIISANVSAAVVFFTRRILGPTRAGGHEQLVLSFAARRTSSRVCRWRHPACRGLTTGHDGVYVFTEATRGGRHLAGKRIR